MAAVVTEAPVRVARPERRLVGRVITYWETARGSRSLPCAADLANRGNLEFAENLFLIEVGKTEDDYRFVEVGALAALAFGQPAVGRRACDVLPSATEQRLSLFETSAQFRKPVADAGRFVNRAGHDTYYRSVIVPVSDESGTVTCLLGAISFKTVN